MDSRGEQWLEAGVDWVTATVPTQGQTHARWLRECQDFCLLSRDAGNDLQERSRLGYDGYQAGTVFIGTRERDSMLLVTGPWADRAFRSLGSQEAHYARIDVQVTVKEAIYEKSRGKRALLEADERNNSLPTNRQRKCRFSGEIEGGWTTYVGSRATGLLLRVYNKGAESKEEKYKGCWRYEYEFRNDHAQAAAVFLDASPKTHQHACASLVRSIATSWGITAPWQALSELAAYQIAAQPETDASRKLKWLQEQVAPSVKWLLDRVPSSVVYSALGLDEGRHSGGHSN